MLAAKLRASNVDPAAGALEELQRIIPLIREKWKETHILVRTESAYARDEILKFCEEQPEVDYAIAMATNSQLKLRVGARITISCRRILIAIATACPYQDIIEIAYK